MPNTVLVTGGSGFVGGWTIVQLLQRGYQVRTTIRSLAKEAEVRAAVGSQFDPEGRLTVFAADLGSDAGWAEAVAGCDAVLHIASPMSSGDLATMIEDAVGGALRVLRAAVDAKVRRVVMTSSTAACTPAAPLTRPIDETDWTDPDQPGLAVYRKSKAVAERAAWDFMAGKSTELVTLLPGAIFGPVLNRAHLSSVAIIQRLLNGQPPALPHLGFNITDVRDLADLHIRAMTEPKAAGERFIVMGDALWYRGLADALRGALGDKAAKVTKTDMPDFAAKALAAVNPEMRSLLPLLGRTQKFSTDKARSLLGYTPRLVTETVVDCGRSLV